MTPVLQIRVLGPFAAAWSEGDPVRLPVRKGQWLIAYLAVESSGTRDAVANLFWGDRDDERARHNVRQCLSKIRSICGPIIETDGDTLRLDKRRCSVDVSDFLSLAREQNERALEQCHRLYAGELLAGAAPREAEFQNWLQLARDRLRNTACDALDRYVGLLMSAGDYEKAIATLNRRLSMDPACESAHRNSMLALVRLGRRSEALRQYDVCVESLRRELDTEPDTETRTLAAEIRGSSGVPETGAPAAMPALSPKDTEKPRLAVLPFTNLSGHAEDEYFVDGITEDIITALSRFHSLQVIARGSAFVYKGENVPDTEIAQALGAKFLVHGSVQRSDSLVRLNVQLLDGPAGLTIWAHRYEREMTDIFSVQDEITATVVSTLAGRVEAAQLGFARKASPERLAAYDYLLRGKDHHHRFTAEDCATCIEMFERAIERDPDYAVAHAWLACGLGQAMVWGLDDLALLVDQSQAAAERGLELDENESECHRILAQVNLTRGDLARALKHQEKALFLNPNDDRSVCAMGEILCFCGRHEEAEQWVRKSMALNPYHPQRYFTHLAHALFHLSRHVEALQVLDQIGRPRVDDLAYAVASSLEAEDRAALQKNRDALQVAHPNFNSEAFAASLPFERAADRDLLRDALSRAGL